MGNNEDDNDKLLHNSDLIPVYYLLKAPMIGTHNVYWINIFWIRWRKHNWSHVNSFLLSGKPPYIYFLKKKKNQHSAAANKCRAGTFWGLDGRFWCSGFRSLGLLRPVQGIPIANVSKERTVFILNVGKNTAATRLTFRKKWILKCIAVQFRFMWSQV